MFIQSVLWVYLGQVLAMTNMAINRIFKFIIILLLKLTNFLRIAQWIRKIPPESISDGDSLTSLFDLRGFLFPCAKKLWNLFNFFFCDFESLKSRTEHLKQTTNN